MNIQTDEKISPVYRGISFLHVFQCFETKVQYGVCDVTANLKAEVVLVNNVDWVMLLHSVCFDGSCV